MSPECQIIVYPSRCCLDGYPSPVQRRRWRDLIHKDLKAVGVHKDQWFTEATDSRAGWRTTYQHGLEEEGVMFVQEFFTEQVTRLGINVSMKDRSQSVNREE